MQAQKFPIDFRTRRALGSGNRNTTYAEQQIKYMYLVLDAACVGNAVKRMSV